jgi:hypothetical protein
LSPQKTNRMPVVSIFFRIRIELFCKTTRIFFDQNIFLSEKFGNKIENCTEGRINTSSEDK